MFGHNIFAVLIWRRLRAHLFERHGRAGFTAGCPNQDCLRAGERGRARGRTVRGGGEYTVILSTSEVFDGFWGREVLASVAKKT